MSMVNGASAAREHLPEGLAKAIESGNCIALVGAGFSAAAGLPQWGQLLEQVASLPGVSPDIRDHVHGRVRLGSGHALDEGAQVLEDHLGRERLLMLLTDCLDCEPLPEPMRTRLLYLRGIPFRAILTTNFDGILQEQPRVRRGYGDVLRPAPPAWWEQRYWEGDRGASVVNLHGDLTHEPASIVLTRRDYRRRLYEDPGYLGFLRAIMATSTILYLGFSFQDAYLNELRSEVLALLGDTHERRPTAYAVANDVPEATRAHFRRHEGIEILSYDSHGGSDFSGFDRYLEAIHEATNPMVRFGRLLEGRRVLWVDPRPENNDPAYVLLNRAVTSARGEQMTIATAATGGEALAAMKEAANDGHPFDLVITHWGGAPPGSGSDAVPSTAVPLLTEIRRRDVRAPVIIFASEWDAERRKREALALGARAYCFTFEGLFREIAAVFASAVETG